MKLMLILRRKLNQVEKIFVALIDERGIVEEFYPQ